MIRKFKKRKVYSSFKGNIWGVVPLIIVIIDLNDEEIVGPLYEKELKITNLK